MTLKIYGAGMAGLLAATMLRRFRPEVHEALPTLPDNHGALLRFRTDAVARETGQPFRKVRVLKAIQSDGMLLDRSSVRDANQYSLKVTGPIQPRSVLDLSPCDRYIAPDDFLKDLAYGVNIHYQSPLTRERIDAESDPIISTIPMPVLMKIVEWPNAPEFQFRSIWTLSFRVESPALDVHQTIYYPSLDCSQYRASITGNHLIIEVAAGQEEPTGEEVKNIMLSVIEDFGIPLEDSFISPASYTWKRQLYGKLLPIPERERKEFILAMTDRYNIYSVGRFATWRQILLDDVVRDVRLVEQMVTERSGYNRRLMGAT